MSTPAPLILDSERYRPTGNSSAEGMENQLGRPKLDQLTVLIRESVQNSWDARAPGRDSIDYTLDLRHANARQKALLQQLVFANCPANLDISKMLQEQDEVLLLTLSDRGTTGLGGHTRADIVVDDKTPQDFVKFLRNIGQPPGKALGGGTFGYGKAALYRVSGHHTIIVYTRCMFEGTLQTRFMAAALGHGFQIDDDTDQRGRYTGRHWWGREQDGIAEPLLDDDADAVAQAIGMPGFTEDECGTSIMILNFDPGRDRNDDTAMKIMAESLLWNLWPKLVPTRQGVPINVKATLHGKGYPIPDVGSHPVLSAYATALRGVRNRLASKPPPGSVELIKITHGRQRTHLGWLAIHRFMRNRQRRSTSDAATGRPTDARSHHIALMRCPELVVCYHSGPPLQGDLFDYAGVFIASDDDEIDRAFAKSEPPTHDEWVVESVQDETQASLVRVGLRKIKSEVEERVAPKKVDASGNTQAPLGALSSYLGEILTGLPGPGADKPIIQTGSSDGPVVGNSEPEPEPEPASDPGPSSDHPTKGEDGGKSPKPSTRVYPPRIKAASAEFDEEDDVALLIVSVQIKHGKNSTGTRIHAKPIVLLDGNKVEEEAPEGAEVPEVYFWRGPDGQRITATPTIEIPTGEPETWQVGVRLVDDARVRVSFTGEALS